MYSFPPLPLASAIGGTSNPNPSLSLSFGIFTQGTLKELGSILSDMDAPSCHGKEPEA